MAVIERSENPRGPGIKSTVEIAFGSLSRDFSWESENNRTAYYSTMTNEHSLPINTESEMLPETLSLIHERELPSLNIDYSVPYWNSREKFKSLDAITYLGEYTSRHSKELPFTVMPPEEDVKSVIQEIEKSDRRLTVPEMIKIGLDKSNDNIVGASLVLGWATRIGARAADERAYPDEEMKFDPNRIINWEKHIAQFEVFDKEGRMDAAGDNYYFFEHLSGALVFKSIGGLSSKSFDRFLSHGTDVMRIVRKYIANRPILTPHHEASVLGRNLGLAIAEELQIGKK